MGLEQSHMPMGTYYGSSRGYFEVVSGTMLTGSVSRYDLLIPKIYLPHIARPCQDPCSCHVDTVALQLHASAYGVVV